MSDNIVERTADVPILVVLGVVWTGALAGMLLELAWPHAPRWVGVPLCIALGNHPRGVR